jgi:cytochrome c oxidase subunit 2
MREPNHFRRIVLLWLAFSVVLTPLAVLLQTSLPGGKGSNEASARVIDDDVLIGIVVPVSVAILVYFAYALIVFRHRDSEEGVAIHDDRRVRMTWLLISTAIVVVLATYGTVRLLEGGAGGGQGPDPAYAEGGGDKLNVQVIGQQWQFTYRFPDYGGAETLHLELPVGREVALHVTSLDVIHSFWAQELGVKADANPGVDNIVYVKPSRTGSFQIRCAELCGLWHGHMFDTGQVVSDSDFKSWIQAERARLGPTNGKLPPERPQYYPEPKRRAG